MPSQWLVVKFAADCPPCPDCGEPWCTEHGEHYGDCPCLGPTEDAEYKTVDGVLYGRRTDEEGGTMTSNDYTLEEIRTAIDRSRESGCIESTPPLLYSIESVLDYLDRHYPGEHLGEEGEPITRLGFRETIEATVWHAWWCDEDGGHIWEVNILLEEN